MRNEATESISIPGFAGSPVQAAATELIEADREPGEKLARATNIRRQTRGANFDRIARIGQGEPYAAGKLGVGENRYPFTKE
jgi:hypothetical protein